MKYIVTVNENDKEEIFLFPVSVNHDCMMEVIGGIRSSTRAGWVRIRRKLVSAGFVKNGVCCGESITLQVKSRPEDTQLLNDQLA